MFLILFCSCFCPIHWSQVFIREWRCSSNSWCTAQSFQPSHEYDGISSHQQLNHFFSILFRLTTKETPKLHITDPLWWESTQWLVGSPHKPVMQKAFPCHDIMMKNFGMVGHSGNVCQQVAPGIVCGSCDLSAMECCNLCTTASWATTVDP